MENKKKIIAIASVFSFFFSSAVLFSIKMPTDFKTIYWSKIKLTDIIMLGLIWVFSTWMFCFIDKQLDGLTLKNTLSSFSLPVVFCFIFLAWFPFYLSFFPGNISGDSYASIYQAIHRINSTAHPVLFTLLVKICVQIGLYLFGSMNAGIAVFSLTQMMILAAILTYVVKWLEIHCVPKLLLILSIVYFAFNPLIVRYSFTMWKDILFSGVMLLLVLFLYDIGTGRISFKSNCTLLRFLILSVLASFLRNRIVYAVIGIFVLLLIIYCAHWKKLLPAFFAVAALILVIQGPIYSLLNIKPSNFAEGQGVSLQQIAAVVVENGDITEEERTFINQIIPLEDIPKAYFESTVDNLKGYKTFDHDFLNEHPAEYIKVWRSVLLKNPWICTKAWLMTTRGFWGFNVWIEPFAITWPDESLNVFRTNIVQKFTGIDLGYFSDGVLVNLGKVPVVRRFFELGSLGWFGAFVTMRMFLKKRYKVLLALLPLNLLWIVLIASTPIFFEARYMFVYHLAFPVLGCILLMDERMELVEG